jgi:hypothetical protein
MHDIINNFIDIIILNIPKVQNVSLAEEVVSSWTTQTTNNNNWRSICWSDELEIFVVVSNTGTGNRVMTSLSMFPS